MLKKINKLAVKYNLYLFLSIIFAIFIFLGSIMPEIGTDTIKNSGFIAHLFSYFVLSLTILLYLSSKKFQKPFIKAALISGSYGMFIEFVQIFLSYRNFQIFDIIINFSGAFLIFIIYFKKNRIKVTKS